ncbi:hypothetical protein [Streptomyces sp. NPDC059957]
MTLIRMQPRSARANPAYGLCTGPVTRAQLTAMPVAAEQGSAPGVLALAR